MKLKFYFCIGLIGLAFFSACTRQNAKEVVLDDKTDVIEVKSGEVVFDDLLTSGDDALNAGKETAQNVKLAGLDNSQIVIMKDNFGNKVETRTFRFHPRLACVILRTAADGKREVLVYGQNGDLKTLPPEMIDRAMTARSDELANAAGIFEGKRMRVINSSSTALAGGDSNQPQNSEMQIKVLPPIRLPEQTPVQSNPEAVEQSRQPEAKVELQQSKPNESPRTQTVNLAKKEDED
ncbi:MAG TPA: hypothetical protein VF599_22165 [Pyrinomonadaceae bacterium]|jgi:hypothetical protein